MPPVVPVSVAAFDVTDGAAAKAGVDTIEREVGALDILVNNAGMQFRAPLEAFPSERWEQLLKTNVSSVFYVGQAVARHMIGRGRGKIINIASVQSELARPGIAPYTATKGAVKNLTRGMCADWARYGLQINAIAPGYFRTPLLAAWLGVVLAMSIVVSLRRERDEAAHLADVEPRPAATGAAAQPG